MVAVVLIYNLIFEFIWRQWNNVSRVEAFDKILEELGKYFPANDLKLIDLNKDEETDLSFTEWNEVDEKDGTWSERGLVEEKDVSESEEELKESESEEELKESEGEQKFIKRLIKKRTQNFFSALLFKQFKNIL